MAGEVGYCVLRHALADDVAPRRVMVLCSGRGMVPSQQLPPQLPHQLQPFLQHSTHIVGCMWLHMHVAILYNAEQ